MLTNLLTGVTTNALTGLMGSGGGGTPVAGIQLDAPASSTMVSNGDVLYAFGFDRLVAGFTGNTVRLKELSGNTEQDFGFDSFGIFDLDAVNTWRSGADVDVVKFYDQNETAIECVAVGTQNLIVSNVVGRFGTTYDSATGLLTRSTTDGAVGVNSNGTGHFKIENITTNIATDGIEIFSLTSFNTRKAKNPANDTIAGSNNDTERMISLQGGTSGYFFHQFFSTFGTFTVFDAGSTAGEENDIGGVFDYYQQYSQNIFSLRLNATKYYVYSNSVIEADKTLGTASQTDISNGDLDNGDIIIGAEKANSTSSRHNALFGGCIVTKELSAADRYYVTSKLGLVGQQQLNENVDTIKGYWDEIVIMSDYNSGTGQVAGINSNLTLQWNNGTNAQGTTTTNFNYTDPQVGIVGINNPDQNQANGFRATDNYFATTTTGTIFGFGIADIPSNQLAYLFTQGDEDGFSTSFGERSLALGRDHSPASVMTLMAASRNTNNKVGSRKDEFGVDVGDARAGGQPGQQAMLKYNRNTANAEVATGQTFDSYTWGDDAWANNDPSAPYEWDAPTGPTIAQDLGFPIYNGAPLLQVATFQAPVGYDRADDQATRDAIALNGVVQQYVATIGSPTGHQVGSVAVNNNASVVDSTDTARICSSHWFDNYEGTYFAIGFLPNTILTHEQIQKFQMNLYKLFEA